jgi:DNA topoisomerase-1
MDDEDEEGELKLPILEVGEALDIEKIFGEQHFTEPPPRYSEASLVKTLEEYGIGRPSTYASIISTLQDREYVLLDQKRFTPTDVGRVVNKFLTEHFTKYVDYDFTAKLESELDDIADGERDWIPVLDNFWQGFNQQLENKQKVDRPGTELLDEACPKCGKPLNKRLGKRGSFIGCTGYPECDYVRNTDGGDERPAPTLLGKDPATGKDIQLLVGPYGPYVQLGEAVGKEKPKRVSIPAEIQAAGVTLEVAQQLLALPREIGLHPETGKKITAGIGRFGPYLNHNSAFKSIPRSDNVFSVDLTRAVELLAQGKTQSALRVLGKHPQDDAEVAIYDGRFGAYVQHGKIRTTLPKGDKVDDITLERGLELLAAKAAKGDSPKKGYTRKTAAKPAASKATAKKTTAKKNAVKKKPVAIKKAA